MRIRAKWFRMAALTAALAVAGWLGGSRPVLAWGRMGHRAASKVTEARMTPAALAGVRGLLDDGETLADASTWADEHRREMPESAPWHYVNVPITEAKYRDKFCPEQGCVVRKVVEFRKTLADPNAARADRKKALRFLIHFVQDMHQPVHVGDRGDRGGNDLQVQFFGAGSNLHRVWDSGLVERAFPEEADLAADLTARAAADDAKAWVGGTVEDWANESLDAARGAYREPDADGALRQGSKLGDAYQAANLPVARRRLAQAGVRLAEVLNAAFP